MAGMVPTLGVHHMTLTVTDLQRSIDFYTNVLGFQKVADLGPRRVLMSNGQAVLALSLPLDSSKVIAQDTFNENHVGLDHVSFGVKDRAALDSAVQVFKSKGVPYGEIEDLSSMGMYVMTFRDPDNIQLELTAPA